MRHGILQLRHGRGEARHETLRCREWLLRLAPAPAGSYRPFPVFVSDIAEKQLLEVADQMLYKAKTQGRNQTSVFATL
ncbi:hypothetical protein FOB57_15480 [Stenotrophomonas maltophilia]|uniref:hypothetical protein n=1 Tax=Pseudomonas guariconensis TaxID=1288410 RepID=UPI00123A43F2|nr:hypothetical protein [Stenotrophomonas maltophilia]QEU34447.1 hypothetical protein FOB57_15480 [Stenotrophomonas maltophilia]